MRTVALVPAAGKGTRLGGALPKAFMALGGRPLLSWAVAGLRDSGVIDHIIVVAPADRLAEAQEIAGPRASVVAGGAERADSVRAGLAALEGAHHVLVHDAARALTPPSVIVRVAEALWSGEDAVIPVLPVTDTVKTIDEHGYVAGTPARATLRAVQTPQGFRVPVLRAAHAAALAADDLTDDAMACERHGVPVRTVPGDPLAFKITTPLDLRLAESLVAARADPRA
ncbi:2-C-methyl-D-erythritol 4-phosphate cytidylyltransferase [Hoyosella sp. G463]|uniref:2-C-methyl-D-erythritol 4-phosphate cytidylyltransferase n=1 Tax=Lolliginicoccus lacisalsi TaxID=2742202 RepID=A0A927JDJ0_9ACTN|nr:2-C-methyl-D-erythritol 4-phosphate cytidylyltransferase [Lolliginicoccus lacisalsi]